MKKLIYLLIPTVLFLFTCDKSPTEPTFDGTFPDPAFEAAVRASLNLPEGEITKAHLDTLTYLHNDDIFPREKIVDITGIEFCKNIEKLNLRNNNIDNISSIRNCTNTIELNLMENEIVDITPLKSL